MMRGDFETTELQDPEGLLRVWRQAPGRWGMAHRERPTEPWCTLPFAGTSAGEAIAILLSHLGLTEYDEDDRPPFDDDIGF